jgi:hypothetical protein
MLLRLCPDLTGYRRFSAYYQFMINNTITNI